MTEKPLPSFAFASAPPSTAAAEPRADRIAALEAKVAELQETVAELRALLE